MVFRRKILLVLVLGVAILILQMFAISVLSSQPPSQLPWLEEVVDVKVRGSTVRPSLQHENPAPSVGRILSNNPIQKPSPALHQPDSNPASDDRASPSHRSDSPAPISSKIIPTAKQANQVSSVPVPREIWNCDISGVKDAMSALGRAKSHECKELIHNVTCLQRKGELYNTNIKNICPLKRKSGRGFQSISYELGKGPLARVVFLLSVHGRAVRQVKRLFKAIYHTDHYYYIHVDSRSDYLHRELYEELSDFPNVYFPSWRMATIWGGASLLQMLLQALQDLELVLRDWEWDYFINLSESDYPIRTNGELVKFLRAHRGENFVKTHGADLKKFIQKQGLDRTFVECDNHMWRVNTRPLPPDIDVDGGSDWIAIHRNYSRYLVTNKDPFLTDLKRYYQFSLLPAESFFHTVLRNGPMCGNFVKTNLRITNWNRKLGCRCQYKHIVDWCGCSPNDFLSKDINTLTRPKEYSFFARKFEAIVNQDVIHQLDTHLFGPLPSDLPGLTSYWESTYHSDDTLTRSSNARYSVYQSFLRTGLRMLGELDTGGNCGLPRQPLIKQVSALTSDDNFKGLVLTLGDEGEETLDGPQFELLYTPISHSRRMQDMEMTKRAWSLEVGSEWDGKESIFRNYGGILGVWDEPVAAVRLSTGRYSELEITWDDPVGIRVSKYNMKLESGWFVSYHKPKLDRPIKPGLWTARLQTKSNQLLIQTDFLVVPLTHESKKRLMSPVSINAQGAEMVIPNDRNQFDRWKKNATKSGVDLDAWMDDLVGQYWTLDSHCRAGGRRSPGTADGLCASMPACRTSQWSTLSPDPKSELGQVQSNGRLR